MGAVVVVVVVVVVTVVVVVVVVTVVVVVGTTVVPMNLAAVVGVGDGLDCRSEVPGECVVETVVVVGTDGGRGVVDM